MEAATLFLVGQGIQAGATVSKGIAAQEAGNYNAATLERQAPGEIAAGQREAFEHRRKGARVQSKQIALAAASGAGGGPSFLDIVGDTAGEAEYRAQAERYKGEDRARSLRDKAKITRWEGRNAFVGSIVESIGGLATGAAQHRLRYGSGATVGSTTSIPSGPIKVDPYANRWAFG